MMSSQRRLAVAASSLSSCSSSYSSSHNQEGTHLSPIQSEREKEGAAAKKRVMDACVPHGLTPLSPILSPLCVSLSSLCLPACVWME